MSLDKNKNLDRNKKNKKQQQQQQKQNKKQNKRKTEHIVNSYKEHTRGVLNVTIIIGGNGIKPVVAAQIDFDLGRLGKMSDDLDLYFNQQLNSQIQQISRKNMETWTKWIICSFKRPITKNWLISHIFCRTSENFANPGVEDPTSVPYKCNPALVLIRQYLIKHRKTNLSRRVSFHRLAASRSSRSVRSYQLEL